MTPVSRETLSSASLDDLVQSLASRVGGACDKKPVFDVSYLNTHGSLLPFLLIALSRLKTGRCVLSIEDYSLQKSLVESLALLVPGFSLFLAGAGEDERLLGADLHVLNLFAQGGAPVLFVPRHWVDLVRSVSYTHLTLPTKA